jgi:hypothetical protein
MNTRTSALLALFVAGCSTGAAPPPASPADAPARARLTVEVQGSGSVLGAVTSAPAGISTCRATCTAELPRGQVTLSFAPEGASVAAQFYLVKGAAQPRNCGSSPAAASDHCTLDLDGDLTVRVYPVSAPPPPP